MRGKKTLFVVIAILEMTAYGLSVAGGGGKVSGGGSRPLPEEIIPVEFTVRGIGRTEIEIIYRAERAYLPVIGIFNFLKLKTEFLPDQSLIRGFFLRPDTLYTIDGVKGEIRVGSRSLIVGGADYFVTEKDVFLRSDLFQKIFGLNLVYAPRRVSVSLTTNLRLPVFAERERERRHARFLSAKSLPSPTLSLGQERLLLGAGRLDWRFNTAFTKGVMPNGSYFARFGGQLLFGDAQIQITQQARKPINKNLIRGQEKYVFLDNPYLHQVILGDIISEGVIPFDVLGVEVTNRPGARRLLFTRETFTEDIGSRRDVDVSTGAGLQAFGKSLDDGRYNFDVPLMYGINGITLQSYDSWGYETAQQYRINVPTELLPPGQFEYSVIAGKLRSMDYDRYENATLSWGVNSNFTLLGRGEYYHNDQLRQKFYPTMALYGRITNNLTGAASVTPSATSRASLSLVFPSLAGGTLTYVNYGRNSIFNASGALSETQLDMLMPFALGDAYFTWRAVGHQTNFTDSRERGLQLGLSASIYTIQPSIISTYTRLDPYSTTGSPYERWETTVDLAARMRADFIFRALAQYEHKSRKLEYVTLDWGRNFGNQWLFQLFLERNFIVSSTYYGLRFAYYFPFARFQNVVSKSSEATDLFHLRQIIDGSALFSTSTGDFFFQNNPNRVGFGALLVQPFLDLNNNGVQDAGESEIPQVHVTAATEISRRTLGRVGTDEIGTLTALPYQKYLVYIETPKLENPLWMPLYTALDVVTEPNHVRRVDLPIIVGGIVRGSVLRAVKQQPLEGATVHLRSVALVAGKPAFERTMKTFSTGEYEFESVPPGQYVVTLDDEELRALGIQAEPASREIDIVSKPDGDIVENVSFTVK